MCARTIGHAGAHTIAAAREGQTVGATVRLPPREEIGKAHGVRQTVLDPDHHGKRDPYRGIRGRGRCRPYPTSRQAWQGSAEQKWSRSSWPLSTFYFLYFYFLGRRKAD
jgi:hypothetical protein